WPSGLRPQAQAEPSLSTARLCRRPLPMSTTFARPDTFTAVERFVFVPSPSWPSLFWPHAQTVPSLLSAIEWSAPALTIVAPARPFTCTGRSLLVPLVPSPIWPYWFQPHAQTVPSDSIARLWSRPPAMATTFARLCTSTGVVWLVVLPIPRLPNSLSPHAHTEPSASTASVWSRAPAIAITFAMPVTLTGVVRLVVVPSPSVPYLFQPHIQTEPSL